MTKSDAFIESKSLRESVIKHTEVLDKVKGLVMLPDDLHVTVQLAADYFEISDKTIESLIFDNKEELESDGLKVLSGDELSSFKKESQISSRAASLTIIPRRAVLRMGMLLRDSEVAKQVRTYLLNIEEEAPIEPDESELSPELRAFGEIYRSMTRTELEQKRLASRVEEIKEVVSLNSDNWRKDTSTLISKIALNDGAADAFKNVRTAIYKEVEQRGGFKLDIRLMNKRKRLAYEGVSKSAQDKLSKVDVIADDKRLIEVYLAVVKDFAIYYGVEVS
jgi:hypothetical protein